MDVEDKARIIEKIEGVRGVMITNKDGAIIYSKIPRALREKMINMPIYMENILHSLKIKPKNITVQFAPDLKIMILMRNQYAIYVLASRYVDVLGIRTLIGQNNI
ncbi:MAG: hypothetical protein A7316_04580 [Candidatus Altiarchaeales archaeon WOR_SM1_86-2]|nr:MAG: hypothetical protein A7316_04580 [Candidatus Altiarchaeales archaeon WOR_SM1_86-2]